MAAEKDKSATAQLGCIFIVHASHAVDCIVTAAAVNHHIMVDHYIGLVSNSIMKVVSLYAELIPALSDNS